MNTDPEGCTSAESVEIGWPVKTRELHTQHFDSTVWNEFPFRSDDIVIATWAKSGTTWTQQIISQLLFEGAEGLEVAEMSPWLDLRVVPAETKIAKLEAQSHRRFIKTHLPVDALVYSPEAKYLYIARDGRDAAWSMHNHWLNASPELYDAVNNTPGRVGPPMTRPPESPREYFLDWLEKNAWPLHPFWENVRSWWEIRHLPNLMLLHFQDLKNDMPGEIRRIAAFLGIPIDEAKWPAILEHCGFDYMKAHGERTVPGTFWKDGAKTFINKGSNGRWRDHLTEADCARYTETARRELGEDCAAWLLAGGHELVR